MQMYDSFKIYGPYGSRIHTMLNIYNNICGLRSHNTSRGLGKHRGCFPLLIVTLETDVVMVFEVLGCNLLKPIIQSSYRGIPLYALKRVLRQV